jgi:hypothetical protein
MVNRWKSKVDALIHLAKDQAGKPEGELARDKLRQILDKYPEAAFQHEPLAGYAREFMGGDLLYMKQVGIPWTGRWQGQNMHEALQTMISDYWSRIERFKNRPPQLGCGIALLVNDKHAWNKR